MTENIEETSYEEKAKFAMLIMGGTTLKEAKKLKYVVTLKDVEAWHEVKENPGDYPPANETSGCAVPTWDWES
jgi:hypothetical protein